MKFKNGDKAKIHSTTSSELDGEVVTIIGCIGTTNPLGDFYIIRGSKSFYGWEAIIMTEHCLDKIDNGQTTKLCPVCKSNDGNMPCTYPSEGRKGCLRDERL